ncbi:MAG: helix-turn-helix domain-containing protein [Ornithinimicrobium sp.]|uniref:helix-turn-helix domain-containing protein n=1 Tax=Ornithinimicrobium sp. TaxID=1977084 RepID=UPI003D9B8065
MQEAAHQLKGGGRPLAQVATDLGYTDQAHFTRDFHRVTGYRPGQFARTLGRPDGLTQR